MYNAFTSILLSHNHSLISWLMFGHSTVLFNCIGCVTLNGKMTVNNELEKTWKRSLMTCFEILYQHLP
jgi:hypothetical protein